MKKLLLLALLLTNLTFADPIAPAKQIGDIKIYVICLKGYMWNVTVIENERGVSIDTQQMTVPSDKGMVTTPLPVKCTD